MFYIRKIISSYSCQVKTWYSLYFLIIILICFTMVSCSGRQLPAEKSARENLKEVSQKYRPNQSKPELPKLSGDSKLEDYLTFAMLNNPQVEAAYYDWAASVEKITIARSRPDPQLTFSADIGKMVSALMVGLMADIPGPGKLKAAGNLAGAESEGKYYEFVSEILSTAHSLKSAYYRLKFLEDNIKIQNETIQLLVDLESLATQQNAAGRGSIQDVLRIQIEKEQLKTQTENLIESRTTLVAEFKAALGLQPNEADSILPKNFNNSEDAPNREQILQSAEKNNPAIQKMATDVRRAQALINMEKKSRVPDFSIGVEADVKADPVMFSPSLGVTLPIWRDKISASISAAQYEKKSAEARLNNESIKLATELAMMLYSYNESLRNIKVLTEQLIPKGKETLTASRTGYATGKSSFLDVIESYRQLLGFDLALIEARTQRELSLISLSLLIAATPPSGSPVLNSSEKSKSSQKKEGLK